MDGITAGGSRGVRPTITTDVSPTDESAGSDEERLDPARLTNIGPGLLDGYPINNDFSSEVETSHESTDSSSEVETSHRSTDSSSDVENQPPRPVLTQTTAQGVTKTTPTLAAETKLTAHKQALLKANPPFGAKHIGSMLGLGFVGLLVPFGAAGAVGTWSGLAGWQAAAAYSATATVIDKLAMNTILSPIPQASFNPDYLNDWNGALDALPGTIGGVCTGKPSESPVGFKDFFKSWGKHFASESITMSPFIVSLYANSVFDTGDALKNWLAKDCLSLSLGGAAAFFCVQAARAAIDPKQYHPKMDEEGLKRQEDYLTSFRQDILTSMAGENDVGVKASMQKLLDSTDRSIAATQLARSGTGRIMLNNAQQLFTTKKGLSELGGRFVCLLTAPISAASGAAKLALPGMVVFGFMFRDEFDKVVKFTLDTAHATGKAVLDSCKPKDDHDHVFDIEMGHRDGEEQVHNTDPLPAVKENDSTSEESIHVSHEDGNVIIDFTDVKPS